MSGVTRTIADDVHVHRTSVTEDGASLEEPGYDRMSGHAGIVTDVIWSSPPPAAAHHSASSRVFSAASARLKIFASSRARASTSAP
jgi:hypothetical protein